jgi:hypothetical protein
MEDFIKKYKDIDLNIIYSDFLNQYYDDQTLIDHRTYIEDNNLGFGEKPFHVIWRELIKAQSNNFKFLEIGVYKGQILSLVKLLSKKYGKNIEYTIIDQVDSLDHKVWKPIETMWIQSFMIWGFDVVNPRKEGGNGPSKWTKDQKNNRKGKGGSNVSRNKGRIVTEEENKKRSETLTGLKRSNKTKQLMSLQRYNLKLKCLAVIQLDKNGNKISEFYSITEAKTQTGINGIQNVLTNRAKTAGGFIWKYK